MKVKLLSDYLRQCFIQTCLHDFGRFAYSHAALLAWAARYAFLPPFRLIYLEIVEAERLKLLAMDLIDKPNTSPRDTSFCSVSDEYMTALFLW